MTNVNVDIVPPRGPGLEPALPLDLIARALEMLPPNERVLNGRLVSKGACKHLSQLRYCTARLGLPLPAQALEPAWHPHLLRALRLLTFESKINKIRVAASTGSEINIELAWGLLRPFVMDNFYQLWVDIAPPAIKAGHAYLLAKMIQLDVPFALDDALEAAAEHCDLPGLQWVWELLGGLLDPPGGFWPCDKFAMVRAAGRSPCDAVSKVSWVFQIMGEQLPQQHMQEAFVCTAAGAAASGNLPVLRLLLKLGMDLPSVRNTEGHPLNDAQGAGVAPWCVVLTGALQGGHVAVADWLVEVAGCPLPAPLPQQEQQQQQQQQQQHQEQLQERCVRYIWEGAGRGGSVEAVRWLLRRGLPVRGTAMESAAWNGHLEAVQFLHQECGLPLGAEVFHAATRSGSLATAACRSANNFPMPAPAAVGVNSIADFVVIGGVRWRAVMLAWKCCGGWWSRARRGMGAL